MALSRAEKIAATKLDNRISHLYAVRCSGIQIPIMKTTEVYRVATLAAATGCDDQALGDAIAAYVETIRVN